MLTIKLFCRKKGIPYANCCQSWIGSFLWNVGFCDLPTADRKTFWDGTAWSVVLAPRAYQSSMDAEIDGFVIIYNKLSPEDSMSRKLSLFPLLALFLAACAPTAPTSSPTVASEVIEQATAVSPTESVQESGGIVSANGGLDACALITQSEAEQVLGTSTGAGEPEDTPPIYSCSYETDNFDLVQVVVVVYEDNAQALDAYQMAIDINGYPELSGLGDRAYNAQPIFDVNVLKGNVEISIDISDSSDDVTQLENAIALAQVALTRLP